MAQTHTHVDYMDYGNLNLDDIMNIGTKGYFKPIPDHKPDQDGDNEHCFCIEPIDQLDNQLLDKVSCPYEDPETHMLPPNCKYNDCRECPKCQENAAGTYGASAPAEKPKKPRAKKTTKTTTKKTTTRKSTKKTEQ